VAQTPNSTHAATLTRGFSGDGAGNGRFEAEFLDNRFYLVRKSTVNAGGLSRFASVTALMFSNRDLNIHSEHYAIIEGVRIA
jgi:hypothetical protein